MDKLNVLYIGDNNYVYQATASIYSLLEHNKHIPEITVYYVNDNLTEESIGRLSEVTGKYGARLVFIPAQPTIDFLMENNIPKYKGVTYAIYQRWFAISEIDTNDGKLLYLDSDTIINGKIDELYDFDLQGKAIGMVKDKAYNFYQKYLNVINYFNTGVILFDVNQYKKEKLMEKYMDFLKTNKKFLIFSEQDVCNIVFSKNYISTMPLRFNMMVLPELKEYSYKNFLRARDLRSEDFYSEQECKSAVSSSIVYHCADYYGMRPWIKGSDSPYNEYFLPWFYRSGYTDNDRKEPRRNFAFKIQQVIKRLPQTLKAFVWRTSKKIQISHIIRSKNK